MPYESGHLDWQRATMNQIAALSGGGLVASASLLWPKAPLPNAEVIAIAWSALASATVAAVLTNYFSAMGNTFISLSIHQRNQLASTPLPASRKAEVEAWVEENRKKGNRRTDLAVRLNGIAPLLFALGVVLLAVWATLSIFP